LDPRYFQLDYKISVARINHYHAYFPLARIGLFSVVAMNKIHVKHVIGTNWIAIPNQGMVMLMILIGYLVCSKVQLLLLLLK
jgi:hypothetical protein